MADRLHKQENGEKNGGTPWNGNSVVMAFDRYAARKDWFGSRRFMRASLVCVKQAWGNILQSRKNTDSLG
jgi:uncharacterized protein (DUF1330 family)